MILGTAGHIDHGKTTLVQRLTGINTDRLKEEKQRGITIELGFAHIDVDGSRIGIVDVPGHERFVRHMVAGAGGLDLVMMVIAADEGIMPQTYEHLEICELMGVERGLIALTKCDLVEEDWLEMVEEELRESFAGTFLEESPMVRFSALDDELASSALASIKRWLGEASRAHRQSRRRIPRLPIDRVFSLKGFGTIVTGTLLGGVFKQGEEVALIPGTSRAKLRTINIHGEEVSKALPGNRTALNLAGVSREAVGRGQVVVPPNSIQESSCFDVELRLLSHIERAIHDRDQFLLHTLTHQTLARIVLLQEQDLEPGAKAYAQIRPDDPVAIVAGDRFVLRGFENQRNHGKTLAGGKVLDPLAPRFRRRHFAAHRERLLRLAGEDTQDAVLASLEQSGLEGRDPASLSTRIAASSKELTHAIELLASQQLALRLAGLGNRFFARSALEAAEDRICETLEAYHREHPESAGPNKEHLRTTLRYEARIFERLLESLLKSERIVRDREALRLSTFVPQRDDELEEALLKEHRSLGLAGFLHDDRAGYMGRTRASLRAAYQRLLKSERLVRVKPDYYVPQEALEALRVELIEHFSVHETLSLAELREITGLSRKHLVPLIEYLDRISWTRRQGDLRIADGFLKG